MPKETHKPSVGNFQSDCKGEVWCFRLLINPCVCLRGTIITGEKPLLICLLASLNCLLTSVNYLSASAVIISIPLYLLASLNTFCTIKWSVNIPKMHVSIPKLSICILKLSFSFHKRSVRIHKLLVSLNCLLASLICLLASLNSQ